MKLKFIKIRYFNQKRLLLMIMKTFIFLFCTTVFSFTSENAFSQNKVVIHEDQIVSVDQVFKIIKLQTAYKFIYPKKLFKNSPKVQLKKGEILVTELLQLSLINNNLNFELVDDNTIIIKANSSISKPTQPKLIAKQIISGTVSDAQGTLPGVSIRVKGTQKGTATDLEGNYTITVNPTDVLVFSFLGYQTQEIAVNNQTILNVLMVVDTDQLQEVVVNAGYYTVKDKERTGSIARMTSKDIESQPVTNVLATMHGRMAGVEVVQESGAPGGAFRIKIRGQNSLRSEGNEPLYIIDGVPYSSENIGSLQTSGNNISLTSPLNSINPTDIESIEILKDADATAIYGSRGANGVVLITTKRGKAGKTSYQVNTSTSFGSVTMNPTLMNTEQYLAMREQGFANDGITTFPASAHDVNGTWDRNRMTDWQKELIGGTATINQYQASVSGGSTQTQYLLRGTYRTETTVYPGDFLYKKGAVHFTMNHRSVDDKFQLVFTTNLASQNNVMPAQDLTMAARRLAPNAPALYNPDGTLNWENSTWENPLGGLQSEFRSQIKDLNMNGVLSYQIHKSIQFKTNVGVTDLKSDEDRALPHTMYDPAFGLNSQQSSINLSQVNRSSWIVEPQLSWTKTKGKNQWNALLGGTWLHQNTERLSLFGSGFTSNGLIYDLSSANIRNIRLDDATEYKYQAYFARLNYNHEGKYILNLTGRRDGSSRFGPGKQFATFGAMGAAWIFSNESLLSNQKILSFGKIRTSYGLTGNDQIGDYQYLDTYATTGIAYQGIVGLQPTRLFNPAFGWETSRKFEMALETGFLEDRLFLTTAYYLNTSSNQLVGIPLPGTTGFTSLNANLDATVQNTGLEFTLRAEPIRGKDFEWSTNFNISINRNKLVKYPGLETSPFANLYVEGEPINIIKLYNYTGKNPETGIYEFQDFNGDGNLTAAADRKLVADLSPRFFGGFQNLIKYKGLQFDCLFQFVKQEARTARPAVPSVMVNQLASVGNDANLQPFTSGANTAAMTAYSRYILSNAMIEDASFIRLKNVSITYNLPKTFIKGLGCQVYMQGQNLLTFTKFSSGDPEANIYNYLPPLKVYTLGLNLTF